MSEKPPILDVESVRPLIERALDEDVGAGDVTTDTIVPAAARVSGRLVARAEGVVAGLPVAAAVFTALDAEVRLTPDVAEGARVAAGAVLARVEGPARPVLTGERTALNFLQRLSGIATRARRYADEIAGTSARIYDTRKTTPGWRILEKYAVRCGGAQNHRVGLFDQILIKDNHVALRPDLDMAGLVRLARSAAPAGMLIEVEVDTLGQLLAVLPARPDIILLDNMTPTMVAECVRAVRQAGVGYRPELEASGGITLENVRAFALAGVDRISIGAITHSAPSLDISLDL